MTALFGFVPSGFADHIDRLRAELDQARGSLLGAIRRTDVNNYLPGAVLGKMDRMSMRHSLEVRTPYLSIEVARFAERLPDWLLVRGKQSKIILREVARRYLPENLVNLPKRGFGLPVSWLRKGVLDLALPMLNANNGQLVSAVGPQAIKNFIATGSSSGPISFSRLWTAATLESWLRHHPAKMPDIGSERVVQTQAGGLHPKCFAQLVTAMKSASSR